MEASFVRNDTTNGILALLIMRERHGGIVVLAAVFIARKFQGLFCVESACSDHVYMASLQHSGFFPQSKHMH